MDTHSHHAAMIALKEQLLERLPQIINASEVVYVDYALHGNVGDQLIVAGSHEFFQQSGIKVALHQHIYGAGIEQIKKMPASLPIVCHGGGNFGDLYPAHQKFRESLAKTFPERRLIVFPQSMHFSSDDALEASATIFRSHPNFHLCVRDKESVEMAKRFTPNVYLVPDTAHMLWGRYNAEKQGSGTLRFFRIDIESARGSVDADTVDWETMFPTKHYLHQARRIKVAKMLGRRPYRFVTELAYLYWLKHIHLTIDKAAEAFGRYETIETDRLHGLILGLLTGRNVIYTDNSVKKLSRYSECWLNGLLENQVLMAA